MRGRSFVSMTTSSRNSRTDRKTQTSARETAVDRAEMPGAAWIFANPITYLAQFGIEAELVSVTRLARAA